ncbi:MAG TPA: nucleotidyltransferase domain-containing protein [Longimicrobium sp.]|nr:nucleotidyltransferase domain-containing protein [Longimicrobium sp.]
MLASPAFARLVLHFALHGDEPEHVRALQRRSGLSMSSLSRELRRLEGRGLVEREETGGRVLYRTAETHPGWAGLRQLIRHFADPAEVVEEAIAGVEGIEAAFVYGSFARGDARADSDIDVLVVGDEASEARLGREVAGASVLLGRPVEIRSYTRDRLDRQIAAGNAVLRRILAGPKRWIVGDEDRLGMVPA